MSAVPKWTGGRLVIASHNAGKVREIGALLAPYAVDVVSAAAFGLPSPEETETTFEGNALIKARAACEGSGLPALADDSGLEIDALGGAPGIYTADWAETPEGRDFGIAMAKAHERLLESGAPEPWICRFVCALAMVWPDGVEAVFRGTVAGRFAWPPAGDRGFGFDPVFVRDGETESFAVIGPERKQARDHRSDAFGQLSAAVFER
ncbi:MAG: non-canonical purine NTP pyrophosphatase [Pseudomonadota bacterium]